MLSAAAKAWGWLSRLAQEEAIRKSSGLQMAARKSSGKSDWSATLAQVGKESGQALHVAATRKELEAAGRAKRLTRGHLQRKQARRWTAYSGAEDRQRKLDERLEALESSKSYEDDGGAGGDDSDFDYEASRGGASEDDEESEDYSEGEGRGRSKKGGTAAAAAKKRKRKAKKQAAQSKKKAKAADKAKAAGGGLRRPTSLARLMLQDRSARSLQYANAAAAPSALPARHFCVVTGWLASTKDPDSGLHFAHQAAYDQIKDQPPPWVRLSGNAPHHEALRIVVKGSE
jgi:hypothetical protein